MEARRVGDEHELRRHRALAGDHERTRRRERTARAAGPLGSEIGGQAGALSDGSRSRRRSTRRPPPPAAGAQHGERRRPCAPRTSRAASRPRRRCTAGTRRACRSSRRAPRSDAHTSGTRIRRSACVNRIARRPLAAARSCARMGGGLHPPEGYPNPQMPTQSPSRTRATVARTLPDSGGARRSRRRRARAHDGRAARGPSRAAARCAELGGDRRDVPLRQSGAVRPRRGFRALSPRRGRRRRHRRRGGCRRRLRAGRGDDLPGRLRHGRRSRVRWPTSWRVVHGPAISAASPRW